MLRKQQLGKEDEILGVGLLDKVADDFGFGFAARFTGEVVAELKGKSRRVEKGGRDQKRTDLLEMEEAILVGGRMAIGTLAVVVGLLLPA